MSENDNPIDSSAPEAAAPDPIKNVKAEFDRKIGNLEETNKKLSQQLDALLTVTRAAPAPAAAPQKKVSVFEDEDAFAASLEEKAAAKAAAMMDQRLAANNAAQAKQAKVIGDLMVEFPELADGGHDFTRRAVEIFNSMSDEEKSSMVAYKTAVQSAALEQGVKPKSKRKAGEDDSFSLGGGSGSSESRAAKRQGGGAIDPRTKLFAEAVGLNLDDPKNKTAAERIKTNHGRKSYNKWS